MFGRLFNAQVVVVWTVPFTEKGKPKSIKGTTVSRYNDNFQIFDDENFWDDKVVYEDLPLIGTLLQMIRDRFLKHTSSYVS